MKKLLSTTAMLASIAFGSAAYAADVYEWSTLTGDPIVAAQTIATTEADYLAALALDPTIVGTESTPGEWTWTAGAATLETFTGTLAEYDAVAAESGKALLSITAPNEGTQEGPYASTSLLDNILANATDLAASVSNISQNLNDIDGSIDVTTSRDFDGLVAGMAGLVGDADSFGSFSQAGANVFGRDIPATLLAVLDPLTLELGALATTAIGTLQSGNMTGSFDADGLVSKVTTGATATGTTANAAAEQYAGIADTIAMQNISVNTGAIDGSVQLIMADVDAKASGIATTAIGALQSGTMAATVMGGMGAVTDHTSGIVESLVGGGETTTTTGG